MRTIFVPVLLAAFASVSASAQTFGHHSDAYYCYWIDAPHKTMATTQIFPGDRAKQKSITGVFAMDMQHRDGRQPRKYECAWKQHAEDAQEEMDSLRATHRDLGFQVMAETWTPMSHH
jgi:hypothetical protein